MAIRNGAPARPWEPVPLVLHFEALFPFLDFSPRIAFWMAGAFILINTLPQARYRRATSHIGRYLVLARWSLCNVVVVMLGVSTTANFRGVDGTIDPFQVLIFIAIAVIFFCMLQIWRAGAIAVEWSLSRDSRKLIINIPWGSDEEGWSIRWE